jgi:hypothetical protein
MSGDCSGRGQAAAVRGSLRGLRRRLLQEHSSGDLCAYMSTEVQLLRYCE